MSEVFALVTPQMRAFRYDPADGAELVTRKVAALYNGSVPAPVDAVIDEDGVLTYSNYLGNPFTANPGDFLIGDGGPNVTSDQPLQVFLDEGFFPVGPYPIPDV